MTDREKQIKAAFRSVFGFNFGSVYCFNVGLFEQVRIMRVKLQVAASNCCKTPENAAVGGLSVEREERQTAPRG